MTKKNTLKQMKTSFLQKCFCANNVGYIVAIFGILLVVMIGIFLQKRLGSVKEQLESCRSSMRGE
jgi:hypothetical protein